MQEAGYKACSSEAPTDAQLYICDLDYTNNIPEDSICFSYDEGKRGQAKNFLQRPIDASKLKAAVAKLLSDPTMTKIFSVEVDRVSRKARTEAGEVRLSEKELKLLAKLCETPMLSREDGAKIFGDGESNIVDVYIHYLRKKLAKVCDGETVKSMRGEGYTLSDSLNIKFT